MRIYIRCKAALHGRGIGNSLSDVSKWVISFIVGDDEDGACDKAGYG